MSDNYGTIQISAEKKSPPHTPPQKSKRRPRRSKKPVSRINKRLVTFSLILFVAFGAYCAAGFFLVPMFISSQLPKYIHEKTGMTAGIQTVHFNPLNNKLLIEDFHVNQQFEKGKQNPLLQLNSLQIDLDLSALLRNGLACDSLNIDSAALSITRNKDNSYNISPFFNNNKKLNPAEIIEFAELPFLFSLNNITVTNSRILFNDNLTGKTHNVDNITINLPTLSNFTFTTEISVTPHFSAVINGSPVELSSSPANSNTKNSQKPPTFLTFDLHSIDLPLYSNYFPFPLPINILKGKAEGKIQFSFEDTSKASRGLTLQFQSQLQDVEVQSKDKTLTLSSPVTSLKGSFEPVTLNLKLDNILLTTPQLHISENFTSKTLLSLIPQEHDKELLPATTHHSASLAITQLSAVNALVQKDIASPAKAQIIEDITFNLQNFSTQMHLNAETANTKGTVNIQGAFKDSKTTFSWQGAHSDESRFSGPLRVQGFQAAKLISEIPAKQSKQPEGTGTLRGQFTISYNTNSDTPFSYNLNDGNLTLTDLKLFCEKHSWLQAKNTVLSPITLTASGASLGKITVKDGNLSLNEKTSPSILLKWMTDQKVSMQEIDFMGSVDVTHEKASKSLKLTKSHFKLTHLSDNKAEPDNFTATAMIKEKGRLSAKGSVEFKPYKAEMELNFSDIDTVELLPLFTPAPPSGLEGEVSGNGHLSLPETNFTGSVQIKNYTYTGLDNLQNHSSTLAKFDKLQFSSSPLLVKADKVLLNEYTVHKGNQVFLTWKTGECENFHLATNPATVECATLSIDEPVLSYNFTKENSHPLIELQQFLNKPKSSADTEATDTTFIRFPSININKGRIAYTDHRLSPTWKINIIQIHGKIKGLDSSQSQANSEYKLAGIIGSSPISLQGSSYFFAEPSTSSYTLTTNSFPIASFGEQLPSLLDIQRNGKFDLILKSELKNYEERGTAHFTFSSVHPTSSNAESALTLALLNNTESTFKLDIPILNNSDKNFKSLFTNSLNFFTKLMVKTSIEPLLLDKKTFPHPDKSKYIEFAYGTPNLLDGEREKFEAYKDFLTVHPQLQLILTGIADIQGDKEALLKKYELRENERVTELNLQRQKLWSEQNAPQKNQTPNGNAVSPTVTPPGSPAFVPVKPQPVTVTNDDLLELARSREEIVRDMLIHTMGIQSSRISLNENLLISGQSASTGNRVKLTLATIPGPSFRFDDTNAPEKKSEQE